MEVLVSFVIVALGIIGFGMAIPLGLDTFEAVKQQRVALLLVRQLMEEIQSKAFEEPALGGSFGLESGEAPPRSNFDDVDDYDNWNESPPQAPEGTSLDGSNGTPDLRAFRRKVLVENVSDSDYSAVQPDGTTRSKRVTVTVSSERSLPFFADISLTWVANKDGMELMYH